MVNLSSVHRRWLPVLLCLALFGLALTPHSSVHAAGVVGNGTPASCTRDALNTAMTGGGSVTFNCGSSPVTINITTTIETRAANSVVDGGGLVTLRGVGNQRIFRHYSWGTNAASTLTLRNMTLTGASLTGAGEASNGAAILSQNQSANFQQDIPTLNIENVTFTSNVSTNTTTTGEGYDFGGGAIFSLGGAVNISNSRFEGNRANGGAGGAVHGLGSNITITNSTFQSNVATPLSSSNSVSGYGGALYVDGALFRGGGGITITGSFFSGNSAGNQGGFAYINLYTARNDFLNIDRSSFYNNMVSGGGMGLGGALSGGGTNNGAGEVRVTITNSLFSGNSVAGGTRGGSGGAIGLAQAATITIANSTFNNNRALGLCSDCYGANGGAIYIVNNPVAYRLINNTIVGNHADWVGGGVTASTSGNITNTVIANNTASNGGNPWNIQQNCGMQATSGGNNLQFPALNPNDSNDRRCTAGITINDPRVAALADNGGGTATMALQAGSPALNTGNGSVCAASPVNNRDQRGITRPQGSACDIGAFEAQGGGISGEMVVDGPAPNAAVSPTVTVIGWAFERSATTGSGIDLVQVFQGNSCAGALLGQDTAFDSRPDVRAAFSLAPNFANTGYAINVTSPAVGSLTFTVCARASANGQFVRQITLTVRVLDTRMVIDTPQSNQWVNRMFPVSGWAFERSATTGSGIDLVQVFQGSSCAGTLLGQDTAFDSRPDVRAAFSLPANFANTGYAINVTSPAVGSLTFTVCARASANGQFVRQITLTVRPPDGLVALDAPASDSIVPNPAVLQGWAIDRAAGANGPGIDLIRVFSGTGCSGTVLGESVLNVARPDVVAYLGLPGSYTNGGYRFNAVFPGSGLNTFTVCARSSQIGQFVASTTRTVRVSDPRVWVDAPQNGQTVNTNFRVSGWAFDTSAGSSGPGINLIRVFRGTQCSGTLLADLAYGQPRPDVRQFLGLNSSYTNTGFSSSISSSPGSLTFTVCARSSVTGAFARGITQTVNVVAGLELETGTPTATATITPTGTSEASATLLPNVTGTTIATATLLPTATALSTDIPTDGPTLIPTATPTETPTDIPTATPTVVPTELPTAIPTGIPTATPTDLPTSTPTDMPTLEPSPTPPPTETPPA